MLGEILAQLDQRPERLRALLREDSGLMTRLHAASARLRHEPMAFAARCCVNFTRDAPPDDWLRLMGIMRQSTDPARAALRFMITSGLDRAERGRTDMDRTEPDRAELDRAELDRPAVPPA